jgi:D-alanine-D-alanine ligase
MDLKPITASRARPLDGQADRDVLQRLEALARDVYVSIGLQTLVRLDIRADHAGGLFILEANPKPDLKAPTPVETSLICLGLADRGMTYDDLILSILADRIDTLFARNRGAADRLKALI